MIGTTTGKQRCTGFTLIELMIVVVIVAILASVAYPSYREHVLKSKRAVAKQALYTIAARQEQYFMDNKTYANSLATLGYGDTSIDPDANYIATTDSRRIYTLSISASTTTTFTAQAVPQLDQTHDAKCMTLTLNETGKRNIVGGSLDANQCW